MTAQTDTRALTALRDIIADGREPSVRQIDDAFEGKGYPGITPFLMWFGCICRPGDDIRAMGAAKALHEAVLPGWVWLCRSGDDEDAKHNPPHGGPDRFLANVWRANQQPNEGHLHCPEWAANPARAWLLAILSALIAEGEGA